MPCWIELQHEMECSIRLDHSDHDNDDDVYSIIIYANQCWRMTQIMKSEVKRCRSCDTFYLFRKFAGIWNLKSQIAKRLAPLWMFCIELRCAIHETKLLFIFHFIFSIGVCMFLLSFRLLRFFLCLLFLLLPIGWFGVVHSHMLYIWIYRNLCILLAHMFVP